MFAVALFASCTQSVEGVTKEMGAKNRLAPISFCLVLYNSVTAKMIAVITATTATATRIANILQPRGIRMPQ